MNRWGRSALAGWALVALWVLNTPLVGGCSAPGGGATEWSPGPQKADAVSVPIPGLGQTVFTGERDTTLTISGMTWEPGASGPGIESLVLNRSASGPLNTRGGIQQALEEMRYTRNLERFERVIDKLDQKLQAAVPFAIGAYGQWQAAQQQWNPPQSQPANVAAAEEAFKLKLLETQAAALDKALAALDKLAAKLDEKPPP